MKLLRTSFVVLVLVGLMLGSQGCVIAKAQGKLLFPATRVISFTPDIMAWKYENIYLEVDGEKTNAWFIPVENARGTLLFSHGNAGNIGDRLDSVQIFRNLGLNVMIYDYGGYGLSAGKASEQRCYADSRAAWKYLAEEKGIPADEIVLFGRSLGGGVATNLATEVKPACLILESSFMSTVTMARKSFPYLPVNLLLRHRFDNETKIQIITSPVLIIHSAQDELIPFHHGEGLFKVANEPKTFLQIKGGHNDGFMISETEYVKGINSFLRQFLGGLESEEPSEEPVRQGS